MTIQEIRHEFFAQRNGIVADTLRAAGMDYKYIFGLQLPQLSAIAKRLTTLSTQKRTSLAKALWSDTCCRESRLLACWVFIPGEIKIAQALALGNNLKTREEADILNFRLLRHLDYALQLKEEFSKSPNPLTRYLSQAIARSLDTVC